MSRSETLLEDVANEARNALAMTGRFGPHAPVQLPIDDDGHEALPRWHAWFISYEPMDLNRRQALCLAMICPSCRNDNRPEARFCDACGQSVSAAPAPARDLRARTPKHLADKILSSGAALEGERKQRPWPTCRVKQMAWVDGP